MNETLLKIRQELDWAEAAFKAGNVAKARVCARRAVGWLVQSFQNKPYGGNIMENLREIIADVHLPEEVRSAAARLRGGNRAELEDEIFSDNPLHDVEIILAHFKKEMQ